MSISFTPFLITCSPMQRFPQTFNEQHIDMVDPTDQQPCAGGRDLGMPVTFTTLQGETSISVGDNASSGVLTSRKSGAVMSRWLLMAAKQSAGAMPGPFRRKSSALCWMKKIGFSSMGRASNAASMRSSDSLHAHPSTCSCGRKKESDGNNVLMSQRAKESSLISISECQFLSCRQQEAIDLGHDHIQAAE